MDTTTRLMIEAGCVIVFVLATTFWGIRILPRLLTVSRYLELRQSRLPASADVPKPDFRAFLLEPVLLIVAVGTPALTLFFLLRTYGALPGALLTVLWLLPAPVIVGAAIALSRRGEWGAVMKELALAARVPGEKRDVVLDRALDADPQLAALARRQA